MQDEQTTKPSALMRLRDISRRYVMGDNVVHALRQVNLDILPGEFVMIVGSSGSGKSTLMQILGCLDVPSEGTYEIQDKDVSRLSDSQLSQIRNQHIGFVFQQFNLISNLTAQENIALPLAYRGVPHTRRLKEAKRHAEVVGIAQRIHHRPTELSGGQSQRVAIARSLVNEPDVILADEPTGNLDSATGKDIMQMLHSLNDRGYTIVMVTHDPKYANQGTRKITLSDGQIVQDEPGEKRQTYHPPPMSTKPKRTQGNISIMDLLRVGIREGLLAHLLRTSLTMLGIIIAVMGVVAMSSFSLGSKKKQADQIRALGANLVRIQDDKLEGEKLADARIKGSRGLNRQDMHLIRDTIPDVQYIAASREIKLNIVSDNGSIAPRVIGILGDYLTVNNLNIAKGRAITEGDQKTSARVAVLGHAVAQELGPGSPVGQTLLLGGTPYRIVGVLKNKHMDIEGLEASGAADPNDDLMIPLESMLSRTMQLYMRSELDDIHIQLQTEDRLQEAATAIRHLLDVRHRGIDDFKLIVPLDLLKQKQQAQKLLDILTIAISSIALIVGGIGIMNIMLASVTERIREIGIRRTVGATRPDIQYQFLLEAIVIAVTGGITGVLLSLLVIGIACTSLDLPIVVSPLMVILAVTASTLTGLGFGLYPAIQASNKNPVEALRYE